MTCLNIDVEDSQLLQQQKLDAVGSLASGVAHEFNNLLQIIRGYTLFALESLATQSQAHKDLQQVLRAAERATVLTRQLLDFSHSEEVHPRPCLIDPIVQELGNMLEPLLPKNIEFLLQLDAREIPVLIDLQHMHQALLNLCLNARDAMPEGGRLSISTELIVITEETHALHPHLQAGDYVCLRVTDTGEGIPPEVQAHMFEPFYTTKEVGKGTGLGLAVTFGVVEQAGGHIECHSVIQQGTTFQIYLPICDERPEECSTPAHSIGD